MSKCTNTAPIVVCFTDAAGVKTTLVEHIIYNSDSVPIGQAFTTADDTETLIDVSGGTIVAGACPIYQPDVERDDLCDVQPDGTFTRFVRRTVANFDENGVVIDPMIVTDFESDLVTLYTVTGEVTDECPCTTQPSLGTITDWSVLTA